MSRSWSSLLGRNKPILAAARRGRRAASPAAIVSWIKERESCTTSRADAGDIPIRAIQRSVPAVALAVLCLWPWRPAGALSTSWPAPPSIEFGELYRAVEMAGLFPDQKTFADAIPREPPAEGDGGLRPAETSAGFDLRAFVDRHFEQPSRHFDVFTPRADRDVRAYIRNGVGGVAAQAGRNRALFVALAPGPPLRRSRREVQRNLLLGQLFRHAGPRAGRQMLSRATCSTISLR